MTAKKTKRKASDQPTLIDFQDYGLMTKYDLDVEKITQEMSKQLTEKVEELTKLIHDFENELDNIDSNRIIQFDDSESGASFYALVAYNIIEVATILDDDGLFENIVFGISYYVEHIYDSMNDHPVPAKIRNATNFVVPIDNRTGGNTGPWYPDFYDAKDVFKLTSVKNRNIQYVSFAECQNDFFNEIINMSMDFGNNNNLKKFSKLELAIIQKFSESAQSLGWSLQQVMDDIDNLQIEISFKE